MADHRESTTGAGASRSTRAGRYLSNAAAVRWPGKTVTDRNPRTRVTQGTASPVARGSAQGVPGDPVTDEQRASAARIRMAYDKKRGRQTENWIKRLAQSK